MNSVFPQEKLIALVDEFKSELQYLESQRVLNDLDIKKIMVEVSESKKAFDNVEDDFDFKDQTKVKLFNALLKDFEKSIQRTLDNAISRKGDKELLIYRLRKIDKKLISKATESGISSIEIAKLETGVNLLKLYILQSIQEKSGLWGAPKMDVGLISSNYEKTILEHLKSLNIKLLA
jgi:hypothetical protein